MQDAFQFSVFLCFVLSKKVQWGVCTRSRPRLPGAAKAKRQKPQAGLGNSSQSTHLSRHARTTRTIPSTHPPPPGKTQQHKKGKRKNDKRPHFKRMNAYENVQNILAITAKATRTPSASLLQPLRTEIVEALAEPLKNEKKAAAAMEAAKLLARLWFSSPRGTWSTNLYVSAAAAHALDIADAFEMESEITNATLATRAAFCPNPRAMLREHSLCKKCATSMAHTHGHNTYERLLSSMQRRSPTLPFAAREFRVRGIVTASSLRLSSVAATVAASAALAATRAVVDVQRGRTREVLPNSNNDDNDDDGSDSNDVVVVSASATATAATTTTTTNQRKRKRKRAETTSTTRKKANVNAAVCDSPDNKENDDDVTMAIWKAARLAYPMISRNGGETPRSWPGVLEAFGGVLVHEQGLPRWLLSNPAWLRRVALGMRFGEDGLPDERASGWLLGPRVFQKAATAEETAAMEVAAAAAAKTKTKQGEFLSVPSTSADALDASDRVWQDHVYAMTGEFFSTELPLTQAIEQYQLLCDKLHQPPRVTPENISEALARRLLVDKLHGTAATLERNVALSCLQKFVRRGVIGSTTLLERAMSDRVVAIGAAEMLTECPSSSSDGSDNSNSSETMVGYLAKAPRRVFEAVLKVRDEAEGV